MRARGSSCPAFLHSGILKLITISIAAAVVVAIIAASMAAAVVVKEQFQCSAWRQQPRLCASIERCTRRDGGHVCTWCLHACQRSHAAATAPQRLCFVARR
jgi:hypothetical protein